MPRKTAQEDPDQEDYDAIAAGQRQGYASCKNKENRNNPFTTGSHRHFGWELGWRLAEFELNERNHSEAKVYRDRS